MSSDKTKFYGVQSAVVREIARRIAGDIVMSEHPGNAMRKWREMFSASQLDVARRMGISGSVVSDYEKGRRTPGAGFIRRFVEALLEIDEERGWVTVKRIARLMNIHYLSAVISMKELENPITFDELLKAVKGFTVSGVVPTERIYGYTVIDSIAAIESLSGNEFIYIMGATTQRALVFVKVTTGRSPLIAVRVAPIKPAVVVIHGTKKVDYLAIRLAEAERIPLVVSLASNVNELVRGLESLT